MLELSFFREYIYYPHNRLHFISVHTKIFFIILYIVVLPCTSTYIIAIHAIVLFFTLCNILKIPISYFISKRILSFSSLLLTLIIMSKLSIPYLIISVPYQLKVITCLSVERKFMTTTNIISFTLSEVIIRIYCLLLNYFILQKFILSTTLTEDVLTYNISQISLFINFNLLVDEIKLIFLLAYQFTYMLEEEIKNLIILFYLKPTSHNRSHNFIKRQQLLMLLVYLSIIQIKEKVLARSQILYTRDIKVIKSQYWLI